MNDSIQIVLVLYKTVLSDCITYLSLKKCLSDLNLNCSILIYNNSPSIKIESNVDQVINSNKNEMLVGAYNYSLQEAVKNKKEWLLLLDQDTEITIDYFIKLLEFFKQNQNPNIVAIAPILKSNDLILSPKKISPLIWWQNGNLKPGYQYVDRIAAFNSLSLLNVDFLNSIGGFKKDYPLDMLDHWVYNQIFLSGKNMYILDTKIEHELSLLNYESNVNLDRHERFLDAEKKFVKEELNLSHYISYKIRLFIRFLKQTLFFKNKKYAKITFKKLL